MWIDGYNYWYTEGDIGMKDLYNDENMNDVAFSIYQFLSNERYTLTDLLKIIIDVIENRLR